MALGGCASGSDGADRRLRLTQKEQAAERAEEQRARARRIKCKNATEAMVRTVSPHQIAWNVKTVRVPPVDRADVPRWKTNTTFPATIVAANLANGVATFGVSADKSLVAPLNDVAKAAQTLSVVPTGSLAAFADAAAKRPYERRAAACAKSVRNQR